MRTVRPLEQNATRADAVLKEREARGLRVPAYARLTLGVLLLPVLTGGAAWNMSATTIAAMFTSIGSWLAMAAYVAWALHKNRHVQQVGLLGAVLDASLIVTQLMVGVMLIPTMGLSLTVLFKSQLVTLALALVAINGLALRPRYPLVVGGTCLVAFAIMLAIVLGDPSVVVSGNPRDYYEGPALGQMEITNFFLFFVASTAAIAFMAHAARKTIRSAIEQELLNAELQREQADVVMREKMDSMAKLVAGVSHELNTPLGAIKSGLDTHGKVLIKLEDNVTDRGERFLRTLRDITKTVHASVERIDKTAESMRNFADLDGAEHQEVDIARQVNLVLERLVSRDGIELKRVFDAVPTVMGDPKALNQALSTLLENAVESIDDTGTIEIRIARADDDVTVAIADSGRGIDATVIGELFEVVLRPGDKRVAASFGLPAAQSILLRHGGSVTVESELGVGSTFTLHLPAREA